MNVLNELKEEFEMLKGQFVLCDNQVYRFIALGQDNHDYFYCLYDGRKLYLPSCLGRLTPLKGYIKDDHYSEIARLASINHFDQPTLWCNTESGKHDEFNENHKSEVLSFFNTLDDFGKNELLTEVHWDIV